jgi:hypothetical protein
MAAEKGGTRGVEERNMLLRCDAWNGCYYVCNGFIHEGIAGTLYVQREQLDSTHLQIYPSWA